VPLNKETLNTLEEVSGFIAAYIYYGTGETLISKTKKEMKDVNVGGLGVEIYRAAKDIVDKMGLGEANFVEVQTDNAVFIHTCIIPGVAAMAVLIAKEGNIGLMKHHMQKLANSLKPEFKDLE